MSSFLKKIIQSIFGKGKELPPCQKRKSVQRLSQNERGASTRFVQNYKSRKNELSDPANALVEACDLVNTLERRIYCFLTELRRTNTVDNKYDKVANLYEALRPNVAGIMTAYAYFLQEEPIEKATDEFVWNTYLSILKKIYPIGIELLRYTKENIKTLHDIYMLPQDSKVPACYREVYPQVMTLMKQNTPNAQITKKRSQMIQKCVTAQGIDRQCTDMHDPSVSNNRMDGIIMVAFMRIQLLMTTFRTMRSREKNRIIIENNQIRQAIQRQEQKINRQVFAQLRVATEGSSDTQANTIKLQNCSDQKQAPRLARTQATISFPTAG